MTVVVIVLALGVAGWLAWAIVDIADHYRGRGPWDPESWD